MFIKKPSRHAVGRVASVGVAVLLQVIWLILIVTVLGKRYPIISILITWIRVFVIIRLVSRDSNQSFILSWTILLLTLPVGGAIIYLLFGRSWSTDALFKKMNETQERSSVYLVQDETISEELAALSKSAGCQSAYIQKYGAFPVYKDTATKYFKVGEELYPAMIDELKKAEYFIFMEYFIIDDGEMWQTILNILEEKARLGLDVRLIYDDFGCAGTMPQEFQLSVQKRGIRCEVFNPLIPIAAVLLNHRDHRKITVIDGIVGFTGGINLADEYINRKRRFGYWKDTGVMLKGEAVWSFTVMFLQMWGVLSKDSVNYDRYKPTVWQKADISSDGFVQPYGDTPLDHESVGENVYLNIINRAEKYVYIFTPYLIIDHEMITALCLAAKSGIDVRIVTPGIPDKKMVFLLTQSYYETLLKAGVRIYEYKPGFLHAKSFVCDDTIATVGTVNLDYRSLYLHFECGVWMYGSEAVLQIKEDALETFRECAEIKLEDCEKKNGWKRMWQGILRLVAPLL